MSNSEKRPAQFVNIVVGTPDDDCPICRATREGKPPAEILKLLGETPPEGEFTFQTLDLTREDRPKGKKN